MNEIKMAASTNVLGESLLPCNDDTVTGYFRDGKCNTCEEDVGSHTVCIEVSQAFLEFSRFTAGRWLVFVCSQVERGLR
jgi:uncharacterized protein (DUF2237 family)